MWPDSAGGWSSGVTLVVTSVVTSGVTFPAAVSEEVPKAGGRDGRGLFVSAPLVRELFVRELFGWGRRRQGQRRREQLMGSSLPAERNVFA